MYIGVPAETSPEENRVAATPTSVGKLQALGYDVRIERGAGARANFADADYAAAGARVVGPAEAWGAGVVLKVTAPGEDEVARLQPQTLLASLLAPAAHPELIEKLARAKVTALAMDAVPRISRAQSLDVLSSMANLAGYRAIIEAAHEYGGLFSGQVTAAGKIPPAKVLVVGAGVAGLAAIGAAGSLGAIVRAFDARPEVAEQVRSMGADFLTVNAEMQGPSADGYAKATSAEFDAAASALYAEQARDVDIIVTTALIPGRPAPKLITADMVASMKPGSVIVDLAAANGGNCELTRPGERVVSENGVVVLGWTDLAGRMPGQASQLYATNLVNLLTLLTPAKDGRLVLDLDDPVVRGMTVTREGAVLWPPPPIQVSAAPAPSAEVAVKPEAPVAKPSRLRATVVATWAGSAAAAVGLGWLGLVAPPEFLGHVIVFALAVFVGFYVIRNVHHALHTPLMSVTNAISGIIIVGALVQLAFTNLVVAVFAVSAVAVASINIFGGFLVTRRMLSMFRREER